MAGTPLPCSPKYDTILMADVSRHLLFEQTFLGKKTNIDHWRHRGIIRFYQIRITGSQTGRVKIS